MLRLFERLFGFLFINLCRCHAVHDAYVAVDDADALPGGIEPDEDPDDNFTDAGNTYYTGYLATAKRLGISAGVGNNLYAPAKEITRQEMFTLLYNALKLIGQLPQGRSGKTLSDFTDTGQISAWAEKAMTLLVETDTVSGSGGKLNPDGTTTRAEMAQVLYNLLGK